MAINKKGTWLQALGSLAAPILVISIIRWALFEPFVIPSGSMIPTLLIHDHIFANKIQYGLHWPFSASWLWQWKSPKSGEVVVFRFPNNPDVFYIKRIVAVSGDEVEVQKGVIFVNGKPLEQQSGSFPGRKEPRYQYFKEGSHWVQYLDKESSDFPKTIIPENSFFVMGDNRDQSNDSRFWGVVPEKNLVGGASLIWLSCDKTLPSAQFICDPTTIRFGRFFKGIH